MLTLDDLAAGHAERQRGLLTRRQALALGFTPRQIEHRVATGRWRIVARGVYLISGAPATPLQRALAACLAGPSETVTSHLTAAALAGLTGMPETVHVTVPRGTTTRIADISVHRANLDRRDRTVIGVIPATTVARTLVDAAALLPARTLTTMVDDALARSLTSPAAVRAAGQRASSQPGRKGLPLVAEALEVWRDGISPGSPAEMRLLRRLAEWGFPPPVRQHEVLTPAGKFRLDLAWPATRIAIEYGGQDAHTPRHLLHDEKRHATIAAAGWDVHGADKYDLRPSADRLRRELDAAFARRRIA